MKTGELNVLRGKTGRRRGTEEGQGVAPPPSDVAIARETLSAFVCQRKDDAARAIRANRERQLRNAEAITDARIRRAYDRECAQREREIEDFWRRFLRGIPKQTDAFAPQHKRKDGRPGGWAGVGPILRAARPATAAPAGGRQLASYSGPVLDRHGRQGVYLSVRYLGAKTASQGCARRLARYVTDPDHAERDANGRMLVGSNVGDTRAEISAAFSVIEELNRAARANAKVAFHFIVQLPHDISPAARAEIMGNWCEACFGDRNLPFVWALHTPDPDGDQRNTHGHVAVSFRPLVRVAPFTWDGGREVKAELDNPEAIRRLRERFAETMTEVCQSAGRDRVYTALSYAGRGMTTKPGEHLGPHKTRLVRQGHRVAADARNRETIARNEAMLAIEAVHAREAALGQRLTRVREYAGRSVTPPTAQRMPMVTRSTIVHPRRVDAPGQPHGPAPEAMRISMPAVAEQLPHAKSTMMRLRPLPSRFHDRRVPAAMPAPHPAQVTTGVEQAVQVARPAVIACPHVLPTSVPRIDAVADSDERPAIVIAVPGSTKPVRARGGKVEAPHIASAPASRERVDAALAPASVILPTPSHQRINPALAEAAFGGAAARRRKRAMSARARHHAIVEAAKLQFPAQSETPTWSAQGTYALDAVEALDTVGTFDTIQRFEPSAATRIVEAIRRADVYVFDDRAGMMLLDFTIQAKLGIDDARLADPGVQTGLAAIRQEQQTVLALLVREAERQPLAFNMHASRTWPRDLDAPLLARLDRWSRDEGFRQDLFLATAAIVRGAHEAASRHRSIKIRPSSAVGRPRPRPEAGSPSLPGVSRERNDANARMTVVDDGSAAHAARTSLLTAGRRSENPGEAEKQ